MTLWANRGQLYYSLVYVMRELMFLCSCDRSARCQMSVKLHADIHDAANHHRLGAAARTGSRRNHQQVKRTDVHSNHSWYYALWQRFCHTLSVMNSWKQKFKVFQSHSKHEERGELWAPGFTWNVLEEKLIVRKRHQGCLRLLTWCPFVWVACECFSPHTSPSTQCPRSLHPCIRAKKGVIQKHLKFIQTKYMKRIMVQDRRAF